MDGNIKYYKLEEDTLSCKGSYEVYKLRDGFPILMVSPEIESSEDRKFGYKTLNIKSNSDDEEREYIVKKYISDLLRYVQENRRTIAEENQKIIDFWEKYSKDFILDDEMELSVKNNELYRVFMAKRELLSDVLEHRHRRSELILDDKISPGILACGSKEINVLLNEMITQINNQPGPQKIAFIQPGEGYLIDYMTKYLENMELLTIFDTSQLSLDELKKKYKDKADRFSYRLYQEEYQEENSIGEFDRIIMVNSIHQFDDLNRTLRNIKLMLKKEGCLHLIDFNQMDAVSLLTAIFFQEQYLNVNNHMRNEFFYKLDYVKDCINNLYEKKELVVLDNEKAFYIQAENTKDYLKIKEKIMADIGLPVAHTLYLSGCFGPEKRNEIIEKYIKQDEPDTDEAALTSQEDISNRLEMILKKNLKLDHLNMNSNYFKLGGNSLSATKLIVDIKNSFNCQIKLNEVFENADFSDLLKLIIDKWQNSTVTEGEI